MEKSKRKKITAAYITFAILGFVFILLAAIVDTVTGNGGMAGAMGVLGFVSWGLSLFFLFKNFGNLVQGEMMDNIESLMADDGYFAYLDVNIAEYSPGLLLEPFKNNGFKVIESKLDSCQMLHKKEFSILRDFVNYYVVLAEVDNIGPFHDAYIDAFETMVNTRKNNIVYLIYVLDKLEEAPPEGQESTAPALEEAPLEDDGQDADYLSNWHILKNINVMEETLNTLPMYRSITVIIAYDRVKNRYVIRDTHGKFANTLFKSGVKKFHKMVEQ